MNKKMILIMLIVIAIIFGVLLLGANLFSNNVNPEGKAQDNVEQNKK